jgi:uncharacterized membrane protein
MRTHHKTLYFAMLIHFFFSVTEGANLFLKKLIRIRSQEIKYFVFYKVLTIPKTAIKSSNWGTGWSGCYLMSLIPFQFWDFLFCIL